MGDGSEVNKLNNNGAYIYYSSFKRKDLILNRKPECHTLFRLVPYIKMHRYIIVVFPMRVKCCQQDGLVGWWNGFYESQIDNWIVWTLVSIIRRMHLRISFLKILSVWFREVEWLLLRFYYYNWEFSQERVIG